MQKWPSGAGKTWKHDQLAGHSAWERHPDVQKYPTFLAGLAWMQRPLRHSLTPPVVQSSPTCFVGAWAVRNWCSASSGGRACFSVGGDVPNSPHPIASAPSMT